MDVERPRDSENVDVDGDGDGKGAMVIGRSMTAEVVKVLENVVL